MEQLNSNIERVIEANSTIEVFNTGAFYALVRAYKYVVVDNKPVKEKINVPFSFDLYNKDNDKISTGTISPGEKATFKVPTYKMVINNTYDYEVHIVFSFGSGTVDQLKTDLEMTTEDIAALTAYDKQDFDLLTSIDGHIFENLESLAAINAIMTAQTAIDKTPVLIQKQSIFICLDGNSPKMYFNAIDLESKYTTGERRQYFIKHIDISFDYSQIHNPALQIYVTNTFNPSMSFGKYAQLKDLAPDTVTHWNSQKWSDRADYGLPTMSKSLIIDAGQVLNDGNFRVDINEVYGDGTYWATDNFILKTNIVRAASFGSPSVKTAIRKYIDPYLAGSNAVTESILSGTIQMGNYNKCANQIPVRNVDSNMLMIDVCVYGYVLPSP